MTQQFIYLGEGYSDFFELEELIEYNAPRISRLLLLHTTLEEEKKTSVILVMNKTRQGNFQALYSILEAIPYPYPQSNKRIDLVRSWAQNKNITINEVEVKSKKHFFETALYEQYLVGVLRLQRLLPPLN